MLFRSGHNVPLSVGQLQCSKGEIKHSMGITATPTLTLVLYWTAVQNWDTSIVNSGARDQDGCLLDACSHGSIRR